MIDLKNIKVWNKILCEWRFVHEVFSSDDLYHIRACLASNGKYENKFYLIEL